MFPCSMPRIPNIKPKPYYFEGTATISSLDEHDKVAVPYMRVESDGSTWTGIIHAGPELPDEVRELLGGEVQCITSEGVTGTALATGDFHAGQWTIHLQGVINQQGRKK